jgi:hypothetical protein
MDGRRVVAFSNNPDPEVLIFMNQTLSAVSLPAARIVSLRD